MSVSYAMICGMTSASGAPKYIWPEQLVQPKRPPLLVYIDLNHWINLSRANISPEANIDPYQRLLTSCRAAIERKVIRIVIMDALYVEIAERIKNPRSRKNLARLIEELTGFSTILGRVDIMRIEVHATMDVITKNKEYHPKVQLLGFGVYHAFQEANESDRKLIQQSRFLFERGVIEGPQDLEIPSLRETGYKPEIAIAATESRRDWERTLGPILRNEGQHWRSDGLKTVVKAREIKHELWNSIARQAALRKVTVWDLLNCVPGSPTEIIDLMPSTAVDVEIKTKYHRNLERKWQINDIRDIDMISVALPYCDIVFTDNEVRDAVTSTKLDAIMNTHLPSTPDDFANYLDALTPSQEHGSVEG